MMMKTTMTTQEFATANGLEYGEAAGMLKGLVKMGIVTDEGVRKAEELAGVESFYTAGNMEWPHLIDNSLKAHYLYKRDVNYMVVGDEVIIVDEHTGRAMHGRQWSDGLHQAIEAKENVQVEAATQTFATVTLQNYFRMYHKLAGMTGTAETEAGEFWQIYKLDVVSIPTNLPIIRKDQQDLVYKTKREKYKAVIDEIEKLSGAGRPVLVGTTSVEVSELLSRMLQQKKIPHKRRMTGSRHKQCNTRCKNYQHNTNVLSNFAFSKI